MSDFNRFKRVVKSWVGSFKRNRSEDYQFDDANMIITNLGMQFRAETLAWVLAEDTRKEDFLQGIYAAEEELNQDIVIGNTEIDPVFDPQVYEFNGKLEFTIRWKGEEIIFAEFELPEALAEGTYVDEDEPDGERGPIDIPIE